MPFELPKLPYAYDALEPYFDAKTMEIHHTKHHAAYTNNLNGALAGTPNEGLSIEEILNVVSTFPPVVRNNAGGFWNHNLFWEILTPNGDGQPSAQMNIASAIDRDFGSVENFKAEFSKAAMTRFGSGWAWLCVDANDKLFICSTPNQDNPLMDLAEQKGTPILGLDVWEHAYYLHYQNRRNEFIEAFWSLVNWHEVTQRYNHASAGNKA
ncbi:MAG: superoxide dismutase [Saprospiraceae bacterium]|nr:superoxide dismutase [Saprospiraceae bacterium]